MPVLKNDRDIESKKTEFVKLYAPTTSWGNIISMNLGYPALRGYWPIGIVNENFLTMDICGQERHLTHNGCT